MKLYLAGWSLVRATLASLSTTNFPVIFVEQREAARYVAKNSHGISWITNINIVRKAVMKESQ